MGKFKLSLVLLKIICYDHRARAVGRSEILGGHAIIAIQGSKFWGGTAVLF